MQGCDTYRPLFWYMDSDKKVYEKNFGIKHSRCYIEYGLKRTGCSTRPQMIQLQERAKPDSTQFVAFLFFENVYFSANNVVFAYSK